MINLKKYKLKIKHFHTLISMENYWDKLACVLYIIMTIMLISSNYRHCMYTVTSILLALIYFSLCFVGKNTNLRLFLSASGMCISFTFAVMI